MAQESMQMALIKYNKKTWSKSALLGFFVGLAVIVPGISGSTVAIIFKLYDQFLYAIGNLFKKFKQCFAFLLPIAIGMVLGIFVGFISVKKLLEIIPFAVVCLFAGLMVGAFPAVKDELKGAKRTAKRVALFCLGLCIPVAIGCVSAILASGADGVSAVADKFANVQWWHVVLALAVGFACGITQIVPGLSASAILMAIGWFSSLMNSVSMTYWKSNPTVFLVYGGLAVGFLLGIFTFSKLLTYVFGKARHTAYALIVGLSLGSIVSMFCNGDIMEIYVDWAKNGVAILDLTLGIALFAVGVVVSYLLVRYQRKKDAEAKTAQEK
jgi:putative membrane protein